MYAGTENRSNVVHLHPYAFKDCGADMSDAFNISSLIRTKSRNFGQPSVVKTCKLSTSYKESHPFHEIGRGSLPHSYSLTRT